MDRVLERVKIVSDPDVMGGEPCIQGTRIPAEKIIINLKAGFSVEEILEAYPTIPPGGIKAAIVWAEAKRIDWRR